MIGHNSGRKVGGIAVQQLKSIIERVEKQYEKVLDQIFPKDSE